MNHDAVVNNDNILSVGRDPKYDGQTLYVGIRVFVFFVRNHYELARILLLYL